MEDLQAVQHGYVLAICNDEDTTMFIQTLILADCELSVKYMIIDIEKLIELNSQNVDQLHRITIALSILEKYTRHLLKPEENRSNMWKYVKFSNQIFKDRVDAIQGGRDLMRMMGYKKDIKDGLAFPDDEKTDPDVLTKMLADILLGKQELNLYLTGSHPHSDYIDKLIPQTTIIELKRFQAKLQQIDPASIPSVNQQPAKQESYNPESQARPVATSYTSPAASPSYHQTSEPVQIPPSQTSPRPVSQSQYTYVPQQPSGMPSTTGKAQQLHHAQPSLGQIDSNQIPLVAKLLAQGKSISSEDIDRTPSTSTSTSKPTTISSEESPIISTETGVPQVQAPQPTPVPQYNSDSMGQTSTEESVFPSGSACDICGNRQAEIICEICDNKQLCQDCDDKWHQHPRRQNHKRQNMPGCIEDQHPVDHRSRLPSHGDSVNTAESHAGQDPKSVLNMSHGGGDDIYVTAHYNPPRPGSAEKQPAMGYITNQMQNLQMEAYGRPRTASGDSGTMEGSPAAEPYSVQTGYSF